MRSSTKKILLFSALAFFLALAPSWGSTAHADSESECKARGGTWSVTLGGAGGCSTPNPKAAGDDDALGCVTNGFNFSICLTNIIYVFTVGLTSMFAYIAAYFFSFTVHLSLSSTAYALDFLSTGWTTVRDIANMAFIFILIYSALTIIFLADTHGTMRMVVAVIVVALLVNFSFFFTRVVIDAGNIFAVQFYNAIPAPTLAASAQGGGTGSTVPSAVNYFASNTSNNTKDLTAGIMQAVQVQNLLNTTAFKTFQSQNNGFTVVITLSLIYIAIAAMFAMLFAAFLTVGVKFMMRIVGLWFLIIASPLALVAKTLPKTEGFFDQWWRMLIKFSFYPAIFLFMYYILSKFLLEMGNGGSIVNGIFNNLAPVGSDPNSSAFTVLATSIATVMIRLGFVIAILYIGLKVADWIVEQGSQQAGKITNWVSGKTFGGTAAAFGWAGRNTAGRTFNTLSKSPLMASGAQGKGLGGFLWRRAEGVVKRRASNTYDPRNAPGATLVKKAFEKATGISPTISAAPTQGFAEQAKEKGKKREEERKERAAIIRDASNKKAIERIADDINNGRASAQGDIDRVKNFNNREMGALKAKYIEKIAHLLNEGQLKSVMDNDKHTDAEKDTIKGIADPIIKSQKIVADELKKSAAALRTVSTNVIRTNTARGSVIDLPLINAMRTDVQTQRAIVSAAITANPNADNTERQKDLDHLHNQINSLDELARNLARIPAIGTRPAQQLHVT